MKYKKLIIASICALTIISCESNTYEEISQTNEIINPTYIAHVKPIITENCISCHSTAGGQRPYLESNDEVKDAILNFGLINQIEAPSGLGMPLRGRMPQTKIDIIKLWSDNGYINQ